jgi:ATP-dependent DNA helicase 2 subunit 2
MGDSLRSLLLPNVISYVLVLTCRFSNLDGFPLELCPNFGVFLVRVSVFVLNTKTTQHHLYSRDEHENDDDNDSKDEDDDIDFPHIIEVSGNGYQDEVRPPWPGLLRRIHELTIPDESSGRDSDGGVGTATVETNRNSKESGRYRNVGGFISGIILAADALHRRTAGKKFHRRIIVITDAEQEIKLDNQKQVLLAVDKIREMKCQLQVVGFDFEYTSVDYDEIELPTIKSETALGNATGSGPTKEAYQNERDEDDSETDIEDMGEDEEEDKEEEEIQIEIKRRNEDLLHKLISRTGGFVFSANDKLSLVNKIWGNKVVKSSKKKLDFQIAPGLVLEDIRCYLMIGASKMPTLKTKIAAASQDGNTTVHNSLGDEMLEDFVSRYEYWKADDAGVELTGTDISEAYRFGSDYIPYNPLDELGLSDPSDVKLKIIGYWGAENVPDCYLMGEPYLLSGLDSRRACAAISALAQALHRTNNVALGTFVKTKDRDPVLMGVFPFVDETADEKMPLRLMMIQLPFHEEMKDIDLSPLDCYVTVANPRVDSACDNLIDSMMLPDDVLDYTTIDNPCIESFYRTVVQRTIDRKAGIVHVDVDDGRATKGDSSKAMRALEEFDKILPRTEAQS